MLSKNDEIKLYSTMYLSAFDKDESFFHHTDSAAIYAFLSEKYWGEGLTLRTKLLVNLLYCDSFVHPSKIKKALVQKSEELNNYLLLNQTPV